MLKKLQNDDLISYGLIIKGVLEIVLKDDTFKEKFSTLRKLNSEKAVLHILHF